MLEGRVASQVLTMEIKKHFSKCDLDSFVTLATSSVERHRGHWKEEAHSTGERAPGRNGRPPVPGQLQISPRCSTRLAVSRRHWALGSVRDILVVRAGAGVGGATAHIY